MLEVSTDFLSTKWNVSVGVCGGGRNNWRKLTMSRVSKKRVICDFCGATSPGLAKFFVGLSKILWRLLTSHGRWQQAVSANGGLRMVVILSRAPLPAVHICETCLRSFHTSPEGQAPSLTPFTCSVCQRQREGVGFAGLHGTVICWECVEELASNLFKE